MIKKISIITLVLATFITIPGCGSSSSANTDQQVAQDSQTQQNQMTPADGNGQGQMVQADLSGEITSISSNQITIKVVKMPEFGTRGRGRNGGGDANNAQNTDDSSRKDQNVASPSNDNQSGNNAKNGGGDKQPGGGVQYTGETKTITIPSDMEITTFARGNNKNQSVKLTDLKQGEILQVWYSDKNKETIKKVSVRSIPQKKGSSTQDTKTK